MTALELIRFMPSYVGSKRSWVDRLHADLKGRPIAELFCGSAILSANLASSALLVDLDPMVYKILSRFDEQIVPEVFTRADYYRLRSDPEWWRYAYCLQSVSYSGVFRYSENGYNVPAKGGPSNDGNPINEWRVQPYYEAALTRWQALAPTVIHDSYLNITADQIEDTLGPDAVVVLDPPYEGSQAAYNTTFDYDAYWTRVEELASRFTTLIFDRVSNLTDHHLPLWGGRKMRVNGARDGDQEGASLVCTRGSINEGLFDLLPPGLVTPS